MYALKRTCSQDKPEQSNAQPSKDSVEQFPNNRQEVVHDRDERCNQRAQRCDQRTKEGERSGLKVGYQLWNDHRNGKKCLLNPRVAMISFSAPPSSSIIRASSPGRLTAACRETRADSRLAGAGLARVVFTSAVALVMTVLIEAMFDL